MLSSFHQGAKAGMTLTLVPSAAQDPAPQETQVTPPSLHVYRVFMTSETRKGG